MRPMSLAFMPIAILVAASALPAFAANQGLMAVRLALREEAVQKIRTMREAGEKVTFHCTVGLAPGPIKETVWRSDDVLSDVKGTLHDLDAKAPYLTFGPLKPKAERKLKYWTKTDSTVQVTVYLDTRSDNLFRPPWNVIAGRLSLSRDAFGGFEKTLAGFGLALSVGPSGVITLAPIDGSSQAAEAKGAGGAGKVETKQSGQ